MSRAPDRFPRAVWLIPILLLASGNLRADVSTYPFFGLREYQTGNDPRGVAAGDFDRDGWPDLAVTNNDDDTVLVLHNRGDGSYETGRTYPTGPQPLAVLAVDVNQDGRLDLLVEDDQSNEASLLLGNADGSFQDEIRLAAERIDLSPKLANVDGDSTLDLLTFRAIAATYELSVQRGNGDGTFQAPERTAISGVGTVKDFAVGDFDGNGRPDVAYSRNQEWFIYLNDGSGHFSLSSGAQAATTGQVGDIEAGDLDGDGDLDLVLALGGMKQIEVLVNAGDGSFAPSPQPLDFSVSGVGMDGTPETLGLADLDGDHRPELFVGLFRAGGGTSTAETRLLWLANQSLPDDPRFPYLRQTRLVDGVRGIAFADVDRDGVPNAIVGGGQMDPPLGPYDAVAVLAYALDSGVPELEVRQGNVYGDVLNLDVGDLRGTPDPEIIFTSRFDGDDFAYVVENLGAGTFSDVPENAYVTVQATDAAIADFNPDEPVYPECRDVATGGAGELGARPGDCLGQFLVVYPVVTGFFTDITELEAADLDLDGHADIAFGDRHGGFGYLLSDGDGNFPFSPLPIYAGDVSDLELADLDLDGDLDFLATDDVGRVFVVKPNGFAPGGGVPQYSDVLPSGANPTALAVGDFDGDAFPDVAVAGAHAVYLYRNQQDGTFAPDGEITAGIALPQDIAAGDVDGDGLDDLAVLDGTDGRENVALYRAAGGGAFEPPYRITSGVPGFIAEPTAVLLPDFDGDGRADLVVGNSSSVSLGKGLKIYRNRGPFTPVPEPGATVAAVVAAAVLAGIARRRRGRCILVSSRVRAIAAATALAHVSPAAADFPCTSQAPTSDPPLPDYAACVKIDINPQGQPGTYVELEDQLVFGLASETSVDPRASGSAKASAGLLKLSAEARIVPQEPLLSNAESFVSARFRYPVKIESPGLDGSAGQLVGIFAWHGNTVADGSPVTDDAGGMAFAVVRVCGIPATDEYTTACPTDRIADQVLDIACFGKFDQGQCIAAGTWGYTLEPVIDFVYGEAFYIGADAGLGARIDNWDTGIAEFEGHTRADFVGTGRWMGVQEVRNALGQPVAEWTLTDLGGEGVDFSQPIPAPEPGELAAGLASFAGLCLRVRRRQRLRVLLALAVAASPGTARAEAILTNGSSWLELLISGEVGASTCRTDPACPYVDYENWYSYDAGLDLTLPVSKTVGIDVGQDGIAVGAADAFGAVSLTLDGDMLTGGVMDLSAGVTGRIDEVYAPDEGLPGASLVLRATAGVTVSFTLDAPVAIRMLGAFSAELPSATLFPDFVDSYQPKLDFYGTGIAPPSFAVTSPGGFDSGWIALPVGPDYVLRATIGPGQGSFENEECEACVGALLDTSDLLHLEFAILPVPEPDAAALGLATVWGLGAHATRRARRG
jgi:hypothetical protein